MSRAVSPQSLAEAMRYLGEDPKLVPAAGCTDLMVGEAEERAGIADVIDLLAIAELRGIRRLKRGLEIGATTTFSEIGRSAEVRRDYPALAAAVSVAGGWQIQNRATLGGNMANASPDGDSLPVLLVLDASVVVVGPQGERQIPYREFHVAYRETALGPGELIARIILPPPPAGSSQFFWKVGTREAQTISKVVVALLGRIEDGKIAQYRLAAGGVAPVPVRFPELEGALTGRLADGEAAELAGRLAAESVQPVDDVRSTAAYRRFALQRVVRRLTLRLARVSGAAQ